MLFSECPLVDWVLEQRIWQVIELHTEAWGGVQISELQGARAG